MTTPDITAAQELARRELATRDLLSFRRYFTVDFDVNWHHVLLAQKLEAAARGEIKRLIITCPPRHT